MESPGESGHMELNCVFCKAVTILADGSIPGYMAGEKYRVRRCLGCGTACADPLQSDPHVYHNIYKSPESIPGYSRYAIYADEICRRRSPLRYLAAREESYWSIATTVERLFPKRTAHILEAGCGLGYMTYALNKAGFPRVVGIDVAESAISYAREHYGCDYVVADIADYANHAPETFDVVIMVEVIEHLEDPIAFLAHAKKLLNPGGYLLCTTPNRSFGGHPQKLWETDLPPVHLWWFTEEGVRELGNEIGMLAEFVDFSPWNRRHLRRFERAWARSLRPSPPTQPPFDPTGRAVGRSSLSKRARASLSWVLAERWREAMHRIKSPTPDKERLIRSPILCAVFR
jgi:SAM-dependent methyltransferase